MNLYMGILIDHLYQVGLHWTGLFLPILYCPYYSRFEALVNTASTQLGLLTGLKIVLNSVSNHTGVAHCIFLYALEVH